jgi:microcystin-dependent protein
MAVEILENTLLKLLVRRGTDSDRRNIVLTDGELGYTTDTERLFIGNSINKGGVVVGNIYQGAAANLTTLAPAVTGDYAYETDTNELKIITAGTGSSLSNWTVVANKITAGDKTLNIDSTSKITVGKSSVGGGLSADNVAHDALGDSIGLDAANRVALSANVNIDGITKRSASSTYVSLPGALKIGAYEYDWPTNDPQDTYFLGTDGNNNLKWSIPNIVESAVAPTTATILPTGTIIPFVSAYSGASPIPYGWLDCNGAFVTAADYRDLSAVIGITYGGKKADGSATTDPKLATTFALPDLTNKLTYGSFIDNTAGSNLYPMASGVGLSASPLSAFGVNYIIKSVGGVTSPTLTVNKNLSAFANANDVTGTEFDFLSGDITITRPTPFYKEFKTQGIMKVLITLLCHQVYTLLSLLLRDLVGLESLLSGSRCYRYRLPFCWAWNCFCYNTRRSSCSSKRAKWKPYNNCNS